MYYSLPEDIGNGLLAKGNDKPIANNPLPIRLEFLDSKNNLVRAFHPKPADYDTWDDKKKTLDGGPWLSVKPGLNRHVWNMRHAGAERVAGNKTAGSANEGPLVSPGVYTARLVVGQSVQMVEIKIVNDPRSKTSLKDLQAQEKMLLAMRDKISETHTAVNKLRDVARAGARLAKAHQRRN